MIKHVLKIIFILTGLLNLHSQALETGTAFEAAIRAYDNKDYLTAITLLEEAISRQPTKADYHLWLGRAYGRQAEQVRWYKAIALAEKTGKSLEKAVELDPVNIDALRDLRKFYLQAPPFLGGGKDKASKITDQLNALGYAVEEE